MPRILDNIEQDLLPALRETLGVAERADFCVGYFNLRGWRHLAEYANRWAGGDESCCRLLIGMHITPGEELRRALRTGEDDDVLDNRTASRERRRIAQEFREQLTLGVPTNDDESALQRLAGQIRDRKLIVKVYLRHPLHAKLYLLYRPDPTNPIVGYLGSSNLTLAGLSHQGELNIDVLDSDATGKLAAWFEDRWRDRWCLDISKELADIIDASWAGDRLVPPYHVYLKMAYHLAREAHSGLAEFRIPSVFGDTLFDFQVAAVKIAAHHLHKRGGVLIGDVVGLGKSIMATALAKLFEEDFHTETLIICPKNLVPMWEDYAHTYRLYAKVLSISRVIRELPEKTRRYRVVLIDESHNLRNKEGRRWRVIHEYIERNESLCILLSATPYNKTYQDLSAQLGLFLREDQDLGIRPERLISELGGEPEFIRRHQCPVRSITAFEKSGHPDDWRDLMRLYMVRRTRDFIVRHRRYARGDEGGKYLEFADGRKSYFPRRTPKTLSFAIDDADPADPYARFYAGKVVGAINALTLPRYGLGNYLTPEPEPPPTPHQSRIIAGLSRAGIRLKGFCASTCSNGWRAPVPCFCSRSNGISCVPNVVYATKEREAGSTAAKGVLVYMRTARDNDALAWMDESGNPVTQSQLAILKAAACSATTLVRPRTEQHHTLTRRGLEQIIAEEKSFGGALGRPSGARFKTYERLERYCGVIGDCRDLFITDEQVRRIDWALAEILRHPLYQTARDTLNCQLKAGADDDRLAVLVLGLREDGRLCVIDEAATRRDPELICSLGLV